MFAKWYRIFGVSTEMYEDMKGTFDENILAYKEESGDIHVSAHLSIFEAWKMRRQMKRWNQENEQRLYLVRM